MPTSKKPRKKYRPRGAYEDPVRYVLDGFRRLNKSDLLATQATNHAALAALVQRNGTRADWLAVAGALNLAVVLDEQVYDFAQQANLLEALQAHARCGVRHHNLGRFGYSGEDLKAVNFAMEVHDTQLEQVTGREIDRAFAETERRYRSPKEHFSAKQMAQRQKENHERQKENREQQEPQLFSR